MALSKNYQLQDVDSFLRILINQVSPDVVVPTAARFAINLAIEEVANELDGASAPTYGSTYTIAATASSNPNVAAITVSGLDVDKIIKVTSDVLPFNEDLIPEMPNLAFQKLAAITQYANSLFYQYFGETVSVWKGSNVPAFGNVTIYYYRLPVPVVNPTDYLDISDRFVPLVVAKAKGTLYEMAGKAPPEALTASIAGQIQAIREGNVTEDALIKQRNKTQTTS